MARKLKRESEKSYPTEARRPNRIKIAGKTYQIVEVEETGELVQQGHACGYISHKDLKIYVNVDWAEDQIRDTILHETLHGCESAAGLEIPEQYVAAISTLLLDALRTNPGLAEYLTDEEK